MSCGVNQENLSHWHWKEWPTENMDFFSRLWKVYKRKTHLGLSMITQSRQSWGRKPSCHRRMLGSDADTPWAAALAANESDLTKIPANTKSSHKNCADWSQRTIKLKGPSAADQYPEQGRKSRANTFLPHLALPASTGKGLTMEFIALEGVLLYYSVDFFFIYTKWN